MKMSVVVSDSIGPNPSTMGEDKAAALDSVRRAQAGDVDAFERLYRENAGRVYALCLRLQGGDGAQATELMQDVFIKAWRRLATFRGDCAFSSWLHRLAVNTMLENARSDRRRIARVLPMEDTSRLASAARSSGVDLRMDMEDAIASLPKGARLAFVLHDVEGFDHKEVAAMLGIAEGTSKSQVFKARMKLRTMLNRKN
jgi:RNA polymerase sigma-70 factor (ECF subfamily)